MTNEAPASQEAPNYEPSAVTDAYGKRVHAPPAAEDRKFATCHVCNATFRLPKTYRRKPKYCSHACRTDAYRIRKEAREAFLAAELAALEKGETTAHRPPAETPKERAEKIRGLMSMKGGEDPSHFNRLERDSRAKSLLERVHTAKPFNPDEASRMQSAIAELVQDQIIQAHRVVMGTHAWSPVQARVFSTMLDKCVPNLSASYTKTDNLSVSLSDMSREDLEKIVAEAHRRGAVIDGEARDLNEED